MRKSLSALVLVAVPALAFSGCNGQSSSTGASTLPSVTSPVAGAVQRHRPHDFSAADLHAGGATFPAFAYNLGNQPVGTATNAGNPNPQQPPGAGSLFDTVPTTGTIYYCLTGSGNGRKAFEGGAVDASVPPTGACAPLGATSTGFGARQDPLDFAGTDAAMSSTDYANYELGRQAGGGAYDYGSPLEVPVIGGPIVYAYRPKEFVKHGWTKPIKFSLWTMCAIANGTVHDWSDPAITADNGAAVVGSSQPLTFFFRSDNSGTSYNFQYHLNAVCNNWGGKFTSAPYQNTGAGRDATWTFGAPPTSGAWIGPGANGVPVPTGASFVGLNGNPGVISGVQATPYGLGYAEGAWAKAANPPVAQAWMQNGNINIGKHGHVHWVPFYADPTNGAETAKAFSTLTAAAITYGQGSDGVPLANGGTADPHPECILYIDPSHFTKPPTGAYPVNAVSYLLFYEHNAYTGNHYADLVTLLNYLDGADTSTTPSAASVMSSLEYVPLAHSINTAVQQAVSGTQSSNPHACLSAS